MEVREVDGVKVIADSKELLTFKCSARRPYYRMRGKSVTKEQAFEIIRRTDNFFNDILSTEPPDYIGCLNFDNWLIEKNHFPQGYGWIHTDGTVGTNAITQKFPKSEEFIEEWSDLIKAFPYLNLVIAITWWDEISPTEHEIRREWNDIKNRFGIYGDFEKEDYDDEFYDAIEIGIYVHDNTVELMSPERTREKYREYVELYEDKNRDKYVSKYYDKNGIVQVDIEYLKRLIICNRLDPDSILTEERSYRWKDIDEGEREMNKITVKTQEELDAVDEEFDGIINIKFGSEYNFAEAKKNYRAEIHVGDRYYIIVRGKNRVVARNNSYIAAHDEVRVEAYDRAWVYADG
ncbi:MAG: hypothetical protein IJH94_01400 [Clostridia bacterium]|nr:hypothetical protein [Clostridia bacterium]